MADCSGCPYLKQEEDHALCTARDNEVIDEAAYTKETCELYQAHLSAQDSGEAPAEPPSDGVAEPPSAGKAEKKREKQSGSTATGCLISLLMAASLMFLCVLALIGLTLFFGGNA